MLCESCESGEDRGDIHIDTEVLNEIAPLAQDRGARKSHHLTIVAGLWGSSRPQNDDNLFPPLNKILAQSLYIPPEICKNAVPLIPANDCILPFDNKADV